MGPLAKQERDRRDIYVRNNAPVILAGLVSNNRPAPGDLDRFAKVACDLTEALYDELVRRQAHRDD